MVHLEVILREILKVTLVIKINVTSFIIK